MRHGRHVFHQGGVAESRRNRDRTTHADTPTRSCPNRPLRRVGEVTRILRSVAFVRGPSREPYGTVALLRDLYGKPWDLIESGPAAAAGA